MRVSRSSGYWQIRARGRYNNREYISNVVDVEERFPTVSEIARHPDVARELENYWTMTKNFASPNGRKEFGCWIYLDTGAGKYVCEDIPNSNVMQGCAGTHGSIKPTKPKIQPTIGPLECGYEYVAIFHTHTPLTYCSAEDRRKPVGPSPGEARHQKMLEEYNKRMERERPKRERERRAILEKAMKEYRFETTCTLKVPLLLGFLRINIP